MEQIMNGLGIGHNPKQRIAKLREAMRFASDSDDEEFLDEEAQEALINLLNAKQHAHNKTYHLTLHLLPLLSLPPYLFDLTTRTQPSRHPLLALLSLLCLSITFYLLLRLPPSVTSLPILDSLNNTPAPLSPSEQDSFLSMVLDSDSGSSDGQLDDAGTHHPARRHTSDGRAVKLRHGSTRAKPSLSARARKKERMRERAHRILDDALVDGRVQETHGFFREWRKWLWTGKLGRVEGLLPRGNTAVAAAALVCGIRAWLQGTEWGASGVSPLVMGLVPGAVYAMVLFVKVCMAGVNPGNELFKYMYDLKTA
ncbi:hypothetical protein C8A05DRAFT_30811 [Staphylotrichum tortipilum]|uniref:Uncharacterized protein n=1 Tax=Staphylotrichum tortipilum TaxID=2831512 RepID=A0AAN6MR37_9PEZI|nr:hypothetical protein C8A05DRAFT_30811 [Staphylotrichum longicolle]